MSCVSQLPQGSKKVKNKPPVLADKASFSLHVTLWCEEDFLEQNMRKRYMFFKQNSQAEDDEKARESRPSPQLLTTCDQGRFSH